MLDRPSLTASSSAVNLDGAPGFRDLGGYPTQHGRRVRSRCVFRSDHLGALTAADLAVVKCLGIRLICDLRSAGERKAAPNPWLAEYGAQELHLDINADVRAANADLRSMLRREPNAAGARQMMLQTYRALPAAFAPWLAGLFARFADGDGLPAVIHCTAGKDRTGFLVAILLHALGVGRDVIYSDYLASQAACGERLRESIAQSIGAHFPGPIDAAVIDAIAGVDASYLDESFSAMAGSHGSVSRYLEEVAGLDPPKMRRLHDALLM